MKFKLVLDDGDCLPILICDHVSGLLPRVMDDEGCYDVENTVLGFFNVKILNARKVKKGKCLRLLWFQDDVQYVEGVISPIRTIDFGAWKSGYHAEIFEYTTNFDTLGMELLRAWMAGFDHFNWRDFDSPTKKRSWLHAGLLWKGMFQGTEILSQEIEIQGAEIECREDLYCALGEAIYGYGGYGGQDLYGFAECIEKIVYKDKKKLTLKIHDYPSLQKVFHGFMSDQLYEKYFFEIFEENGCVIIV